MTERASKVIGCLAYFSPERVICTEGQACVIAGSEQAMRAFVEEIDPVDAHKATMKKTRFEEVFGASRRVLPMHSMRMRTVGSTP